MGVPAGRGRIVPFASDHSSASRSVRTSDGRPAPRGFQVVPGYALVGVSELPCDVFIRNGSRALLYATIGTDAAEIVLRTRGGVEFFVRNEDTDLLRRSLVDSLPGILGDQRLPPVDRSRTAYTIASHVVSPMFVATTRVERDGLRLTQDAIDAVTSRLLQEEDLVWAMVATMQRHLQTHTHAINTAVYALILARHVDISESASLLDIGRGALLHDIGKNRVPASILDKPGPLDADEWRTVRTHPRAGYDIVTGALGTVPGYAHIIAEHHERADGSGYPHGRRAHQVALDSQLVAIVDAFDAITSDRPYKKAATAFEALRIMRFEMRGQFNRDLLKEFINLLGGWGALRRSDLKSLRALRGA